MVFAVTAKDPIEPHGTFKTALMEWRPVIDSHSTYTGSPSELLDVQGYKTYQDELAAARANLKACERQAAEAEIFAKEADEKARLAQAGELNPAASQEAAAAAAEARETALLKAESFEDAEIATNFTETLRANFISDMRAMELQNGTLGSHDGIEVSPGPTGAS